MSLQSVGCSGERVNEGRWVPVTTNGQHLQTTIGWFSNDLLKLIGHTTRLGDVCDGTRAVQLRSDMLSIYPPVLPI